MGKFGWSLPPGVYTLPGEEPAICEICGRGLDGVSKNPDYDCQCPECPECNEAGNLSCWYGDKKHSEWPNRDKYYCLMDILYYSETPLRFGRMLYKHTDCGPWTSFIVYQGDDIGYEDKEANGYIYDCIGIKIGSIVEGSEAYVEGRELLFPFTKQQLDDVLKEVNEEASFYWERDNSTWLLITSPKGKEYYCHETWGEVKWDGGKPRNYKKLEPLICNSIIEWDENGVGKSRLNYNEPVPILGAEKWGITEIFNDSIY